MELVSYALDFTSFLIQNIKDSARINSVILFGSVARGEATKESDVDIFIDIQSNDKNLEKEIKKITDQFFDSIKFKKYWQLLNVKNEINVVVGRLEEWKLKDSMLGSSIILYQKYAPKLKEGKNMTILTWKNVKENSSRVMLNKKVFGYNYYGKFYNGLIQKYDGKKLGANTLMVPIEYLSEFTKLFKEFKITLKIIRIFEYSQ